MRFSVDWLPDGKHKNPEERATLCDLRIEINGKAVSAHVDSRANDSRETLTVPIVHLAEGIAANWWAIFGGRDVVHSVLPWRMGFALPDVRFECVGSMFLAHSKQLQIENPPLVFWQSSEEFVPTKKAETELARLLGSVVEQLDEEGLIDTEVQLAWSRVQESRADREESSFCEAAGALGVDPYEISDEDASFIEEAGKLFSGDTLIEFLADVRAREVTVPKSERRDLIQWINDWRPKYDSALPELRAVADQLSETVREVSQRPPWAIGHHAARAFRAATELQGAAPLSIRRIAQELGSNSFRRAQGPRALQAVVAREEQQVHIDLRSRGSRTWDRNSETFAFARAIGDAVCFSDAGLSTINGLHRATRQAVGRAFAAEFLAPRETVLEMCDEGRDVEEIAGLLEVHTKTVEHQIENAPLHDSSLHWNLASAV